MFLTRMALDINREDTQRLLRSGDNVREAVNTAFAYGSSRVLWRLDEISYRTWLVMLSHIRPELNQLHQQYGYLGVFPSWETFDYDDDLDSAYNGTCWDFDLCAAPVGVSSDRRETWAQHDFLYQWLGQQADICGFTVLQANEPRIDWRERGEKWVLMVRWTGRLRVTDADLFQWAVASGIGGARELGAGLMTISGRGSYWGT